MRTFKEILASAKGNITKDILDELSEAADRENINMLEAMSDLLGGKIPEGWRTSYRITVEAKEGDSYRPVRVLDATDFLLGVKDKHSIKAGLVGDYTTLLEIYFRVGASLGEEHLNKAHKAPFKNSIEASFTRKTEQEG